MRGKVRFAIFLLPMWALLTLGSCEELLENTEEVRINIPIDKKSFSVDSSELETKNSEILLHERHVNVNVDSVMEAEGLDYLVNARLKELILGMEELTSEGRFFLKTARITVSPAESFSKEIKVAYKKDINTYEEKTVKLTVENINISNVIRSHGFYLRIYGTPVKLGQSEGVKMFLKGKVALQMDNS